MKNILSILFLSISLFSNSQNINTDISFNPGLGFNSENPDIVSGVYSTALQSNGKIIVGGDFTSFNGVAMNYISRLNSNGSLDTTFNSGIGFDSSVYCINIQADGKILVGGLFSSYNGTAANKIIRLNSDGSVDNSFIAGYGIDGEVRTICIQTDGKIIVGGSFTIFNGVQLDNITRLNSDGSLDNTFSVASFTGFPSSSPGFYFDPIIYSIFIQPDGKIIVGGSFGKINSTSRNCIARMNSNGSLDVSFNPGSGFDWQNTPYVISVILQTDGKIIVTGGFDHYNGTSRNSLARINTDGTIDLTFITGNGLKIGPNSGYGNSLAIQPDGKILVGGNFTAYNGVASKRIVRLNSNGSIDNSFNIGNGFDGQACQIFSINLQPDMRIITGGKFTSFNWKNRMNIARIIECNSSTNSSSTINIENCQSFSAPFGVLLETSGTYSGTIQNYKGCDSLITINFIKYPTITNNITFNTCSLPYIWNSQTYNSYGTYTQVFQTIHGCDSTVNLTLNYLPISNQNICIVGVNPTSGKNKVVWEKEQTAVISNYNIYRENTQSGSFDLIGTTNYTDSSVFEDILSNTNQQAYRYQIKYLDTCGNESSAGNIHKTIHLTINQGVGPTWNLIWTPYDGVSYSSYNIYRGSSASNMSLLTTVPSNLTSYTDANAPIGNVYYQIEIVGPNCNPSKSSYNTSRSNISTNDSSLDLAKIENTKFSIYPNPANNFIHIDYDGNIEKLEIIDAKGTVVFVSKENKKEYALPTHLQTGYYLVKIYSENQIPSRKELFIQR
jgi:uncharacterized delta-60 repeat protein